MGEPGEAPMGYPPQGYIYIKEYLLFFMQLFAASFPLAPLIALLVNVIDIRVDARRMLWMYRRPISHIAQDIGKMLSWLQKLHIKGFIS